MGEIDDGTLRPGRLQLQGPVGLPAVVVTGVLGKHVPQVPLVGDEHLIGDLGTDRKDKTLRVGVHPRTPRRDLRNRDPGVGEHRIEGVGELPRPDPE